MIIINKPIYYCEHCSKKALTKHTIAKHEPVCFGNEANRPACVNNCAHLQQPEQKGKNFTCTLYNKELHTEGAVVYGLTERYPEQYEKSEVMPKKCLGYENFGYDAPF